jgi:orotate phosphoribosyltransferase
VERTHKYVACYGAINTIRGQITDKQFKKLHMRSITQSGLCGEFIRPFGLSHVEKLKEIQQAKGYDYAIMGIGGVTTPEDYELYLSLGADAAQSATGAMMDPYLAHKIYQKESELKAEYALSKSFGIKNFAAVTKTHDVATLRNMYMHFIFNPKTKDQNILHVAKKPFELKHGERGRKTSHIYLNHRQRLLSDTWDRRFLAKIVDMLIRQEVPGAKKGYGLIATTTSSSPELTAEIIHEYPEDVKRVVIVPHEILQKEKGAHPSMYGEIDTKTPWIIFDDVFTSGKTFAQTLNFLKKKTGTLENVYCVVLTLRGEEKSKNFENATKHKIISLTTLNEILRFHWKQFKPEERKLILSERPEINLEH